MKTDYSIFGCIPIRPASYLDEVLWFALEPLEHNQRRRGRVAETGVAQASTPHTFSSARCNERHRVQDAAELHGTRAAAAFFATRGDGAYGLL